MPDAPDEWPAPDYWCTICDRGAEGCLHTPADITGSPSGGPSLLEEG